jgi:hypothetical protein
MGISSSVEKTALFVGSTNSRTGSCATTGAACIGIASNMTSEQLNKATTKLKAFPRDERQLDGPRNAAVWFLRGFMGSLDLQH